MKTEHTPGPWEVRQGVGPFSDRENDYQPFDICTENFSELYDAGKRICTLSDGWSKEDKANARLIAAAPEMLELLKSFAPLKENGALDHIWSALMSHQERHYADALRQWGNEARAAIAKAEAL